MRRVKPLHLVWKRKTLFNMFIRTIHVSLCSINLCLENGPGNVYLKTFLWKTQIQIQKHGLKFDQLQIQLRRICICICKSKYVFDHSPDHDCSIYLRHDQKIWITTMIHIFTKAFKRIECGWFLRDYAGFHSTQTKVLHPFIFAKNLSKSMWS